jgi:D-sedoheptulose 7-phosphate isomerase
MVMRDFVEDYLTRAGELVAGIEVDSVVEFIAVLFDGWRSGATVYTCGNGGSASTAQHMAADLFKCTSVAGKRRFRALSLNDNMPLLSALTNDDGWSSVYVRQLETWWRRGDVLITISVHGGVGRGHAEPWSQNLLAACGFATSNGGRALGIVGFDGGAMARACRPLIRIRSESAPIVEGASVVLHHLVTAALSELIRRAD